jgi:enoyl-CoA hydratase
VQQQMTLGAERRGAAWVARFSRADGPNTLTPTLVDKFFAFLRALGDDPPECRSGVLTGEGRAFLAGTDVEESIAMNAQGVDEYSAKARPVTLTLTSAPVPVIAALNGFTVGGGCELALTSKFIYAAEPARFGLPEVKLRVVPGMGETNVLALGQRRARELLYTGAMISAHDSRAIGPVDEVCAEHELVPKTLGTAARGCSRYARSRRRSSTTRGSSSRARWTRSGPIAKGCSPRRIVRRACAYIERRTPSFSGR